jgi:hypothetical protein
MARILGKNMDDLNIKSYVTFEVHSFNDFRKNISGENFTFLIDV